MDSVTIRDYRCFRGEQTARMAPLTLLVGENSTGKTSFLAILRALWEVAVDEVVPDFRREPYDLGAFSEIVYNDSSRGEQPDSFQAAFRDSGLGDSKEAVSFRFTFQDLDGVTFPISRYESVGDTWFEVRSHSSQYSEVQLGISDRCLKILSELGVRRSHYEPLRGFYSIAADALSRARQMNEPTNHTMAAGDCRSACPFDENDLNCLEEAYAQLAFWQVNERYLHGSFESAPFASAPVRSKPRRTYDPSRPIPDPEGEYVPTYLANMSRRDPGAWRKLRERLEKFGSDSGLFDEISIESFGRTDDATPFQIQIRKFGGKLKGNRRNLIDVGYGVSQALPIITELLRPGAASMFLLQQPEVHLHPSAQAALGSLFCSIAGPGRQLVVETHSDYIIDRVRMDVRDKKTDLKPEDVSILYFERGESDVKIHSIRLDEQGNVLDAPDSYGQFFMEETRRSIGL